MAEKYTKIDNDILDFHAKKMGPTLLGVYIMYAHLKKTSVSQVASMLGITRPTVVKARDQLVGMGFFSTPNVSHEKFDVRPVRATMPSSSRVKIIDKTVLSLFIPIYSIVLLHPRYKTTINKMINQLEPTTNQIQTGEEAAKVVVTPRVERTLLNLSKHGLTPERVEEMAKWWVREKLKKPFNWALFCCNSMVEEFQRKNPRRAPGEAKVSDPAVDQIHKQDADRKVRFAEQARQNLIKRVEQDILPLEKKGVALSVIQARALAEYRELEKSCPKKSGKGG